MTPPPSPWRPPALIALGVLSASLFAMSAFALWQGNFGLQAWLSAAEAFLSALVMTWWTALFARLTQHDPTPPENGTLRALAGAFPWLSALRLSLWLVTGLVLLGGAGMDASPVALTALMTVWGAAILAWNAVYGTLTRLAPQPGDPATRQRLLDWLNVTAALSVGMGVLNTVPIAGFSTLPTLTVQLTYALNALLEVAALLLAYQALRGRTPTTPGT